MKQLLLSLAFALTVPLLRAQPAPTYHILSRTTLGGEGFWDYVLVDPTARHLYVTHDSRVEVLDVDTKKRIGTLTGTGGAHGVAVVSKHNRGCLTLK